MMFGKRELWLVSASAIALNWVSAAYAQTAPGTPATGATTSTQGVVTPSVPSTTPEPSGTASDGGDGIQDIVVIARRRDEALQDVPITITALSTAQIEQKSLRAAEDLRSFVPGLNVSGQRRDDAQFFLRGQGPGVVQANQRNFTSVATYFAEVPTAVAGPGVFYDLASVQVLKGPQGTLFGRNTTGGAVLFEPNRPTHDDNGYLQATYGNYDYKQLEGVLNLSIVPDVVALRLTGQISRREGFTRSVITDQKLDGRRYEAFRGSLLLTPREGIENLTIFDFRDRDNSGTSAVLRALNLSAPLGSTRLTVPVVAALSGVPLNTVFPIRSGGGVSIGCLSAALPGCPTGPFGNAIAAYRAAFNGGNLADPLLGGFALVAPSSAQLAILARQQALGVRRNLSPSPLRTLSRDYGITNKTSVDVMENLTFKNIIAYRVSRLNQSADFDGTPLNFLENLYVVDQKWGTGAEQFTEEFQLQGKLPSADLSYILGYYHEESKPGFVQEGFGSNFGVRSYRLTDNKDVSNALFAHFEWNPSDLIGLSGGVRKTWDRRFASLSLTDVNLTCTQAIPGTTTIQCPLAYRANFDAWTYDGTVTVKPTTGLLLYGTFRRGYKSGGVNLPAPDAPPPLDPAAFQTFAPETVRSLEAGVKADFNVGVPVRLNLAGFYDKYKNIQISQTVIYTPVGSAIPQAVPLVQNNVNATNKGFELEATVIPIRALSLSGFLSYLDAAPSVTVAGASIKGRQFANQPKWKYGISGVLQLPVPETVGAITASLDYSWQGKVFTAPTPRMVDTNPSYGILNGRLEWKRIMDSRFDLSFFGTNLTNKVYVLGGYPIDSLGFDSAIYGEPRTYGASLRVNF